MKNEKKDYIARTFKLPVDLVTKLDKYSEETGISRTFVLKKSLEQYFAAVESNQSAAEDQ